MQRSEWERDENKNMVLARAPNPRPSQHLGLGLARATGHSSASLLDWSVGLYLLRGALHLRMACEGNRFLRRCTKQFGMQIQSTVPPSLQFLDWDAMCIRPRIVADAGYQPGHFHVRLIRLDREVVVGHLAGND